MQPKQPVSFSGNPLFFILALGKDHMLQKIVLSFGALLAIFSLNAAVLAADSDPDTLRVALLPD